MLSHLNNWVSLCGWVGGVVVVERMGEGGEGEEEGKVSCRVLSASPWVLSKRHRMCPSKTHILETCGCFADTHCGVFNVPTGTFSTPTIHTTKPTPTRVHTTPRTLNTHTPSTPTSTLRPHICCTHHNTKHQHTSLTRSDHTHHECTSLEEMIKLLILVLSIWISLL